MPLPRTDDTIVSCAARFLAKFPNLEEHVIASS